MAVGDILTLKDSIAARLIRCLYIIALILIAVMVVLGVIRGIRIMSFAPPPPPAAASAPPAPQAGQPPPPQMGMMQRNGRMMMNRRMMRRPGMMGPRAPFGFGRNPVVAGALAIFFTLLRGAIVLMLVRVLAEIGLAILSMPRSKEI